MGELISGKEALIALANGELVEMTDSDVGMDWTLISPLGYLSDDNISSPCLPMFFDNKEEIQFRLKPRTIKINEIEVPSHFKPKDGDRYFYIANNNDGYMDSKIVDPDFYFYGAWRTEEEIKKVVSALRLVFNGGENEKA